MDIWGKGGFYLFGYLFDDKMKDVIFYYVKFFI